MEARIFWHYTCPICGHSRPSNFGFSNPEKITNICKDCKEKEEGKEND